jgi:hypothetical protein
MTCSKYRKQLVPWLDNELKPEKANELKVWFESCEVVRQCTRCRKLIAEYKALQNVLDNTPKKEFPAFLHYRIIDKVNSNQAIYRRRVIRTRWQAIPATIAILLSLYLGSLIGVQTFNPQQTTTASNTIEQSSFGENSLMSSFYDTGGQE